MLASSPGPSTPKNLEGPGDEATELHGSSSIASFPGRSRLQFLIAYCMFLHPVCDQKLEAGTAWERG